jgi:LPS sulfotransferase NodH
MQLSYEEVARDVDASIRAIADAFHLRLPKRETRPIIEKARSSIAEQWRDRFAEECEDFVGFWREYRGMITAA